MNYRALCRYGTDELSKERIDDAALDARLLLEYVCHTDRNYLLLYGDRAVGTDEEQRYRELIGKRKEHIPLQYLTGEQEFMGLNFFVNENVLIPRADTEILVEEIMKESLDGKRILEIGAGSGCIILSLLKYSNHCVGVATDISAKALEVAGKNAERLGILADIMEGSESSVGAVFQKERPYLGLVHTDLVQNVVGKFDIIVSNPPYINREVIPTLMPEVKDHEPVLALDGGDDGLDFYRRIMKDTQDLLALDGAYYFEIGYDQGEAVKKIMQEYGCCDVEVIKDYAGLDRVVRGYQKGRME